jgi:MFS family permease
MRIAGIKEAKIVHSNPVSKLTSARKEGSFYGWFALAGAMIIYFTGIGIFFYSYGVFLPLMCSEYEWSRTLVGAGLSVSLLAFGLPSPLVGASIARFGSRVNIIFGNLLFVIGLAGMSIVTEIWQLYFFYGILVGLGAGFGVYMACTTVANDWFIKKRSLVMGLVTSAGGLGGFIFPPLITELISSIGWQISWLALAAIHLVFAVLVGGLLLVRNKPENMEQVPDGPSRTHSNEMQEEITRISKLHQSAVDWHPRQAIRNPTTWLIIILGAANYLALGTITAHQVAYINDAGFSPAVSAMTLSLIPAMSILGRLGFGFLGIRFHVRHLAIASFVIQLIALTILLTTESIFLIYVYAALFGISSGALSVALLTFVGTYYGSAHYAQILGIIFPLTIVVEAVGPIMAGAIHDTTGTYMPAFAIIIGANVIGLICTFFARRPSLINSATEISN